MKIKNILLIVLIIVITYFSARFVIFEYLIPYKYYEYVNKYSSEYDLDPLLVLSVIKCESNFDEVAVSKKDAKGLMQIMDATGEWAANEIGIEDFDANMLLNAEVNIKIGCWYLNNLREEFGDLNLVIAAYNGGSGNVNKWLNDDKYSLDGSTLYYIPFKETKKYVDKVNTIYSVYKFFYN